MQQTNSDKQGLQVTFWVLALVCVGAIIFSLCGGAAYAGIQQARLSAAKASIGHIEAVLFLAEDRAEQSGLGPRPTTFTDLLKSYDYSFDSNLTAYERFVLEAMLESFGAARDFDFAITRFEDAAGVHTQIYFFPNIGRTDIRNDRYYLMTGGKVTAGNG